MSYFDVRKLVELNIIYIWPLRLLPLKGINQRTNGPVNAHLISWPSKAQNIQNLENKW